MSAADFLPTRISITSLRAAADVCRGCPLYKRATQTVFGRGRASARLLLVGEQPGNEEDLQGEPFVGPAGRILNEGLEAAGIGRAEAYVTNVVKHFKWVAQARRRLHKKPSAGEIGACRPWLEKEIEVIQPERVRSSSSADTVRSAMNRPISRSRSSRVRCRRIDDGCFRSFSGSGDRESGERVPADVRLRAPHRIPLPERLGGIEEAR